MTWRLPTRQLVVILVIALMAGILVRLPDDATINLRWMRWVLMGVGFLGVGAGVALRRRQGVGTLDQSIVFLSGMGVVALGALVPAIGGRTAPVDDAVNLGAVVLLFCVIAISVFQRAWKQGAVVR